MRLGALTLRFVSDGTLWADGGALFGLVPRVMWQALMEPDDRNRLPFETRCLLVETGDRRILVGTGWGDKRPPRERSEAGLLGERRLLGNLAALGVGPGDIDLVINTHLHGEHCGGNTCFGPDGTPVPTFPNAVYCVQRLELADALYAHEPGRATYRVEDYQPLLQAGRLEVLSGDTRLTDQVRVLVTPGHTRAHQSVVLESEGQTAVYVGDVAPWPIQVERPAWVPAFDAEPLVSIETKRSLARWAVEHRALLIFERHPEVAVGYLYATERPDRFRLEPVEVD